MDVPEKGQRGRGRPRKTEGDLQPFTVRLPKQLYRQLKLYCTHQSKSLNDLAIEVLDAWWAEQPKREHFVRLAEMEVEYGSKSAFRGRSQVR